MTGTTIDHMVSIIIFFAAMLLFIGLFSQTVQTAIIYQNNSALALKTSDLLDNMLLSTGNPADWSRTDWEQPNEVITGFGLQDPEFTQYQINPFSLMRLSPITATSLHNSVTEQNYSNLTMSLGQSLVAPSTQMLSYAQASELMGISGSYGFILTFSPTVNVEMSEPSPMSISMNVKGSGFPLANAKISYCLIITGGTDVPDSSGYILNYGTSSTNAAGLAFVDLTSYRINASQSYAVLAYASLSGLSGIGYYEHPLQAELTGSVVPIIYDFETHIILIEHSYNLTQVGYSGNLNYTATFLRASDFVDMGLNNGAAISGELDLTHTYDMLALDPNNLGILLVTYTQADGPIKSGIIVMPWGFSSLGFSLSFGGNPVNQSWVSTDIRQVLVNNIAYQAKLELWSYEGIQVID